MAAVLQHTFAVPAGGVVAVFLPPSAEFVIATVALLKCGGILLPFYMNYTAELIQKTCKATDACAIVTVSEHAALMPETFQGKVMQGYAGKLM